MGNFLCLQFHTHRCVGTSVAVCECLFSPRFLMRMQSPLQNSTQRNNKHQQDVYVYKSGSACACVCVCVYLCTLSKLELWQCGPRLRLSRSTALALSL